MSWLTESLKPLLDKYKIEVFLLTAAFVITFFSGLIFLANQNKSGKEAIPTLKKLKPEASSKNIIQIDLSGAVEKANVYEVSSGARLKDILILAGGLSQDAHPQFFSRNFNLARVLHDQEKVYIPTEEETQAGSFFPAENMTESSGEDILGTSEKVNVNLASIDELDSLPGIGKVTAEKIIKGRPYASLDELLNKKIVGKSLFEKIKDSLSL